MRCVWPSQPTFCSETCSFFMCIYHIAYSKNLCEHISSSVLLYQHSFGTLSIHISSFILWGEIAKEWMCFYQCVFINECITVISVIYWLHLIVTKIKLPSTLEFALSVCVTLKHCCHKEVSDCGPMLTFICQCTSTLSVSLLQDMLLNNPILNKSKV